MGIFAQQGKMSNSKKPNPSNNKTISVPSTFKQNKNDKNDTKAFNQRIKIWLDKNKIYDEERRISIIVDLTKLYIMHKLDVTAVGPVIALFITHKEEQVSLGIVESLANIHFEDNISPFRLYQLLAWTFEDKHPVERRCYSNRLTLTNLNEAWGRYRSREFKKTISEYQPPLQRILPDNSEHRKSLQDNRAPTLQSHTVGHSQSTLSLRLGTPSSPAPSPFTNSSGYGNFPTPSPMPTSPFIRAAGSYMSSSPTPLNPAIKREHSPDHSVSSKKAHTMSEEGNYMHQRLNNEYTAQYAELVAKKANKLAALHYARANLDEADGEIAVWFDGELEVLKAKEARQRANL